MRTNDTILSIVKEYPSTYGLSPFFFIYTNDIASAVYESIFIKNANTNIQIPIHIMEPSKSTNIVTFDEISGWYIFYITTSMSSNINLMNLLARIISDKSNKNIKEDDRAGIIIVSSIDEIPEQYKNIIHRCDNIDKKMSVATERYINVLGINDKYINDTLIILEKLLSPSKITKILTKIRKEYAGNITPEILSKILDKEKIDAINSIATMKIQDTIHPDLVVGLDEIKNWVISRYKYSRDSIYPKGILILGIPGTGKTMIAKAIGNILQRPVIRYNPSAIFDKRVGSSEANIRRDLELFDMLDNVVLFIDEIEKQLSGIASSGATDGGVTARVIGNFISWLQDRKSNVFVVATANSVDGLPPEMLRTDRFDEIFFVDFPGIEEREKMFKMYIDEYFPNHKLSNTDISGFALQTEGYTGSDIKYIINESYFEYNMKEKDLKNIIKLVILNVHPFSKKFPDRIAELQKQKDHFRVISTK